MWSNTLGPYTLSIYGSYKGRIGIPYIGHVQIMYGAYTIPILDTYKLCTALILALLETYVVKCIRPV